MPRTFPTLRHRLSVVVVAVVVAVAAVATRSPDVAVPAPTSPAPEQSPPAPDRSTTPSGTASERTAADHPRSNAEAATPNSTEAATSIGAWLNMDLCHQALQRLNIPPPPLLRIECRGPRHDVSGYAHPGTGLIEIFWRPTWTLDHAMSILGHELGHLYDFQTMTYADREHWKKLRGLEGMAWRGCTDCDDFYTPAGDFAEAFALTYSPDPHRTNHSKLGGHPTPEQSEFIRSIVDRADQDR